jgi:hypothetical protein
LLVSIRASDDCSSLRSNLLESADRSHESATRRQAPGFFLVIVSRAAGAMRSGLCSSVDRASVS